MIVVSGVVVIYNLVGVVVVGGCLVEIDKLLYRGLNTMLRELKLHSP